MLVLLLVLSVSCKHEIPARPSLWEVETVINRGNILDLGVSNSQVCILNSKPEVGVLDRKSNTWQFYNRVNSLISNVSEIQNVGDTTVLLSDDVHGLFSLHDTGMVRIDTTINTIGFDYSGDVCRANARGLYITGNGITRKVQNQFQFGMTRLSSMAAKDDTIWVGTQAYGLFYADVVNKKIKQASYLVVANYKVKQITYDDSEVLWIVTEGGVSQHKNGNWKVYHSPKWLKLNHMTHLGGEIYLATDIGVYKLNVATGEYIEEEELNEKLPYQMVNVIEADSDDNMWLGTGIGLIKCRRNSML